MDDDDSRTTGQATGPEQLTLALEQADAQGQPLAALRICLRSRPGKEAVVRERLRVALPSLMPNGGSLMEVGSDMIAVLLPARSKAGAETFAARLLERLTGGPIPSIQVFEWRSGQHRRRFCRDLMEEAPHLPRPLS